MEAGVPVALWVRREAGEAGPACDVLARDLEAMPLDELPAYVQRLRSSGLQFRVVGTFQDGRTNCGVFLTTGEKSWEELTRVPAVPERLADWQGTVLCVRIGQGGGAGEGMMIQIWGRGGERLGPFGLFGDPALRAKIRQALSPSTTGQWPL